MDARHCGQNEHTRHGGTACRPWNAGSFIAGMVKAAHPFTDAASVMLRQPGMETSCPKGRAETA
ncbi:hypothetical protein GID45_23125 [Salmonella enterica]|nr:hypothetical protein [Salmonella enterica subsp. enterica serovar Kimberley]EEO0343460.1 hypothetical protein [Salmonella enterica]EJI7102821.1 hypothetical protein [Salmonella enterica]HAK7810221.1 hypothetical protein [Salmonella enterica]HAK8780262.1 hypothetical protein [Salmonella enterica]